MGVINTLRQAASEIGQSGRTAWDVTKNFSIKGEPYVPKPAGMIEKAFGATLKGAVVKPFSWGLKTVDAVAGFLLTPLKWLAAAPGAYFKAFPRFAPISVVLGVAAAIGSYFTQRRSHALQENFAEAQQAAMQAQAAPYTNSVSPQEYAAMQAAIENPAGGHANKVEAVRAAAAANPAVAPATA
jgi:hypothetical protein